MNYAGRMNSFIFKGGNVLDAIAEYKKMHGLTHLEFNYPEHVEGYDIQELKKAMGDLSGYNTDLKLAREYSPAISEEDSIIEDSLHPKILALSVR